MRTVSAVLLASLLVGDAHAAEVIPWDEGARHVGRVVRVEGYVEVAERTGRRLTLRFAPSDPDALTVTLLIPLVTDLPAEPEAIYRARRVQAYGRITRAAGHLEMVLTDPDRLTIVGLSAPDADVNDAATGGDAAPPAPPPAPAPPAPTPPPATGTPPPDADETALACARHAASRDAARTEALAATEALRACLDARAERCSSVADRIAAPVARLERIEQTIRASCPGS